MNKQRIEQVEAEIIRVQQRIAEWKVALAAQPNWGTFPKENGALRRASLDLTRALADMRKPEVYR